MDLTDRTVIVTGAAHWLGRAYALVIHRYFLDETEAAMRAVAGDGPPGFVKAAIVP